jgi:hypothetical protein
MEAYESAARGIVETPENSKAVDELTRLRLIILDDEEGSVRLNASLRNMLDQGLKASRLRMVSANIGEAIEGIKSLAKAYRSARKEGNTSDTTNILIDLRANVLELCDDLREQSREIWQQIDSGFGTVTLLSSKRALNESFLAKIQRILDAFSLIDFTELFEQFRNDRELLKLHSRLRATVEKSRQDLGDSIHRLNKMMYHLNLLAAQARLVNRFVNHYTLKPSFQPDEYCNRGVESGPFSAVLPLLVSGSADITNDGLEIELARLITGLRKELPPIEDVISEPVTLSGIEREEQELAYSEFKAAVRDVFFDCIDKQRSMSAVDCFDKAPVGSDLELWIYALISEYNAMPSNQREFIKLDYTGEYCHLFTGNFLLSDLIICPH